MNLPWHHTFLSLHLSAAFTIRLPSDSTSRWTPLSLAVSFPLLGRIRDFHPLETCAARRTRKRQPVSRLSFLGFCLWSFNEPQEFNLWLKYYYICNSKADIKGWISIGIAAFGAFMSLQFIILK